MPGAVPHRGGGNHPLKAPVRLVLLDIEGTVGPVSFVRDVLFPYAHQRIGDFLREHSTDTDVTSTVTELRRLHSHDMASGDPPPAWGKNDIAGATAYARWLIDRDRKVTPLKDLQGRIWKRGYEMGELKAPLFDDVAPAFRRWRASGIEIAIYSSGSVMAQRLYFAHTTEGDLTPAIRAYFDTTSGPKTNAASYARIASALNLTAQDIVFVSDTEDEVAAADAAGLRAVVRAAPGETAVWPHRVPDLTSVVVA
jgi:enolase-phosphatase E1